MEQVRDTDIEQSEQSMFEVANIAVSIQQLCSDACQNSEKNAEAHAQISAIRCLAALAGYHADLAIKKIGNDPGFNNGAEDWLCSPAYNKLSQQPAVLA